MLVIMAILRHSNIKNNSNKIIDKIHDYHSRRYINNNVLVAKRSSKVHKLFNNMFFSLLL